VVTHRIDPELYWRRLNLAQLAGGRLRTREPIPMQQIPRADAGTMTPRPYWQWEYLGQWDDTPHAVTPQSVTIRTTNPDWYDEAYTYSQPQIRGLMDWTPRSLPDDGYQARLGTWSNIISSPISGYNASFWADEPASKTAWIVKWGKFWEMLGIAHEARIYNKEVELVDGELKIS
jgi:hypothetical protein